MEMLIYLVIGLVVGLLIGRNQGGFGRRIKDFNKQRSEDKAEHLDEIMLSFGENEEITNDKVEHMLGVSNATAERYLDELEKQGKLVQVGKTGVSVAYRKAQ